ncbi:MAG TPA: hypothetical protein PK431_01510 [Chitinophagales bacterium]|nr:hypothetical protein [Chitinophagales bacterium]
MRIVLRLTGLTHEAYVEMQLQIGRDYLENMLGDDPLGIEYVYKGKMFWKWFINSWQKRDADEFVNALYKVDAEFRCEKYRLMHFNWCVVRHQKPHMPQSVLDEMYLKQMDIKDNKTVQLVKR